MSERQCTVTIVAQDPSILRDGKVLTATVNLPWEDLEDGPMGCSLYVADYDASTRRMYRPAKVKSGAPQYQTREEILTDPVFHAWNVYAIVMRTLMRFEFGAGPPCPVGYPGPSVEGRAPRLRGRECVLLHRR